MQPPDADAPTGAWHEHDPRDAPCALTVRRDRPQTAVGGDAQGRRRPEAARCPSDVRQRAQATVGELLRSHVRPGHAQRRGNDHRQPIVALPGARGTPSSTNTTRRPARACRNEDTASHSASREDTHMTFSYWKRCVADQLPVGGLGRQAGERTGLREIVAVVALPFVAAGSAKSQRRRGLRIRPADGLRSGEVAAVGLRSPRWAGQLTPPSRAFAGLEHCPHAL